jgi:predicted RNA-binding Zn ribbon-like protein
MAISNPAKPSKSQDPRPGLLPLIGGVLCLDFANSVSGLHDGEHEIEHLSGYEDLIAWAMHADALPFSQAQALVARGRADGPGAARAHHRALGLRDAIHDVFAAIAVRDPVPEQAMDSFNAALTDALRHARILPEDGVFKWGWDDVSARLEAPLWPVLRSAADLLTTGKLDRIKQCPYPHCGWLFVDLSKNKSRRWCEMSVCGNRTKARRHYMREKRVEA